MKLWQILINTVLPWWVWGVIFWLIMMCLFVAGYLFGRWLEL